MTSARTQAGRDLLARFIEAGRRWPQTRGYFTPQDVLAIENAPDSLDAAWSEAEAALPEGYVIESVSRQRSWWGVDEKAWTAEAAEQADGGDWPAIFGDGDTPAAALRALAARLREAKG